MLQQKNVSSVIREVGELYGKVFNTLPTRQTVDNLVDRKLSVSQKHVGVVLAMSSDTTLYTDKTRKHGHTYQSYIVSDSENVYLLGLREMVNKSETCALDTFKTIFGDLTDHCKYLQEQNLEGVGY